MTTETIVEPVLARRGTTSAMSADGWDLEGIPPRFWPKIRELLRIRAEQPQFSAESLVVASAMVNALTIEAIGKKAGNAGEGMARAASSLVADWDGDLCPPYRKWPPKKKRLVAEEIVTILSSVLDVTPEGALSNSIRELGGSMAGKLNASQGF